MGMSVSDLTSVATRPVKTRFRRIATPIPVPESIDLIRRLREVEPQSMAGMVPIVWHRAQGFQVRDPYGNQWIDLSSGIVMANSGHAHPRVLEAIRRQTDSPLLFTYAYPGEVRQRLLERLVKLAPPGLDKAILFSSGTEANECAITLMRRHGQPISPRKTAILSLEGNYHGRTLAAKAASGGEDRVDGIPRDQLRHFLLPTPGQNGFAADLLSCGLEPVDVAGVILESIPGVTTACHPLEYVRELRAWATRHGALMAVDEIQCGMGRTGKMFAIEHYGVVPDLITCGKGLSSSLPVSAVIGAGEVMDLAPPGEMSSTFGGNPVCAAAAEANLELMDEEGLVQRAAELGERLEQWLAPLAQRHAGSIGQVDGKGLFYSIHLKNPDTGQPWVEMADRVALECVRRGVLLFVTGRGFLKIVPPLTIEREALEEAVEVIAAVLDEELAS